MFLSRAGLQHTDRGLGLSTTTQLGGIDVAQFGETLPEVL